MPGLVSRATFLGADLFVLISLMVALGYNELHCIISLADLLRRDERVALRRIYRQLDRRWINADVPNVIAMVSAHPRLYQLVGLTCSLVAAVHAGRLLQAGVQEGTAGLAVLRDVLLIVLVQWQVQWYAAAYRTISGKLLPEK